MNCQQNVIQKDLFSRFNPFCIWNEKELPGPPNVQDKNSTDIIKSLDSYSNYSLNDLSNAKLMNRIDTKFLLPLTLLPRLLADLCSDYSVLEIGDERLFTYENTYFDTPDMQFYNMHHNGKQNRFKMRYRRYVETDTAYIEIKFKSNKKRMIKKRIKVKDNNLLFSDINGFATRELQRNFNSLYPRLSGRFRRISLADEKSGERITIDSFLSFKDFPGKESVNLPKHMIAELKQYRRNISSPFFNLMRHYNMRPVKFSKYCIGTVLLNNGNIKSNRFKQILIKIN